MSLSENNAELNTLSFEFFCEQVLKDYYTCLLSREFSIVGRKEVLMGRAKFGIFGDGVEVPQVVMARFFNKGDFRAGYYRDQTFMLATGMITIEQLFAQLYGDTENDPVSQGRQMNNHFSSPFVDQAGQWLPLTQLKNVASDLSPTSAQMPKALGLAFASKCFRRLQHTIIRPDLSIKGNEVCFCTIGDASTSEGYFWETINAAGVLQVPLAVFVYDNGYGISVEKKLQTTKQSISLALRGLAKNNDDTGVDIYKLHAGDYSTLIEIIEVAIKKMRETHTPAIFHIDEVTQPLGHSTSGSHERYKSTDRLFWEKKMDCITLMRNWILEANLSDEANLVKLELQAKEAIAIAKEISWNAYQIPIREKLNQVIEIVNDCVEHHVSLKSLIQQSIEAILLEPTVFRLHVDKLLSLSRKYNLSSPQLSEFIAQWNNDTTKRFNSFLYAVGQQNPIVVTEKKPIFILNNGSEMRVNGSEILNKYFDQLFARNPLVFAFGEDVGMIGDVNQGFVGLQEKYSSDRIFDTGIREASIVGKAIGMALRGLRPIAEIQYLDYLLFGLELLSDEVASLCYRTAGTQACPLIIRTRGHRLEGIWHAGSPLGLLINSLRGMYICVPRNMVEAVGMYNTLLSGNVPGLVIEPLNGYRLKEDCPTNLLDISVAMGVPEVLKEGADVTVVSYGSTLRIVLEVANSLEDEHISCEVIDVRTLLPFDKDHLIVASLKKTNRIIFIDEDVPSGATAFMFEQVIHHQKGYQWLDAPPKTMSAQEHRTPYGSDGDYFSKPNFYSIMDAIKALVSE
ncbi:MAG: thiamine pyrophosphate-dependent enzyme [Phycisphaerales bacterium]|nr:thiamine pyrophosphate-dependent enzyme [Phycisphaerales bacterium]